MPATMNISSRITEKFAFSCYTAFGGVNPSRTASSASRPPGWSG